MLAGGKVEFFPALDPSQHWEARKLLIRSAAPRQLADLA
jgi:hypothetical protein